MVDFAAGVRITARHCFMLETVSVCVRPTCISVKHQPGSVFEGGVDENGERQRRRGSGSGRPLASGEVGHHSRQQPQSEQAAPASDNKGRKRSSRKGRDDGGGGKGEEVQFADEMWSQLVGRRGYLAGDERWVLGEDEEGRVTIVRF